MTQISNYPENASYSEMRKMTLKPVTFSLPPILPIPPLECALDICNAICAIMASAIETERVLGENLRLREGF